MAEKSFPPYECTLSPELIKKAEEELNEKAEWRSRDIQALREMVLKQKDLHCRTDDAFLLRFLRAKKFDYDRAFNLLLTHYQMRKNNAELFCNLRPSAVKHVLEAGVTGVLPHRDKNGCKVIVFRPGLWDPGRFPLDDVFRTNFMTMSKIVQDEATQVNGVLMFMDLKGIGLQHARNISPFFAKRVMSLIQEEAIQINGVLMIMDLKGIKWRHIRNISPKFTKKIMGFLQDAFPLRFKGLHYLNEPTIFDYIFSIVKPFMKEKTKNRLHFHSNRYKELEEFIDPEYLPEEYGGKAPKFSNSDWKDLLLNCDAKYGLVDGVTQASKSSEDAMEVPNWNLPKTERRLK
ncbi:hypothetical protein FSP39_001176 [Pinctada imbricata]|uniref:CRAL-TRIO domain-containing protein n=1 Tax=Pinctada imbricata TaxID=66713 RepID=A0AA88XT63_PINIB|nr:hypothetical protein FSP39_001176 [Pinctada imbricata]